MTIITLMAMPHLFYTWKVQVNGLKEENYAILYNLNPKLKKKTVSGFITAKWKVSGAGAGSFPPMSSITPIINIMEEWGYQLQSCCSVGLDASDSKMGKLWVLRKKDCFRMMLPPTM